MSYVSKESTAGGGLRLLALLIATSLSIIPFTATHEATAADTDSCSEGCTAYTWNGDSVAPLKAKSGVTPKFTALGTTYRGTTYRYKIPTLKDSSGSIWTVESTDYNLVKDSTLTFGTSENNGTESAVSDKPFLNFPLTGHGGRGFTNAVFPIGIGTIDGKPSRDINQLNPVLSVDSRGRLWISSINGTAQGGYMAPTVAQDSDDIEFTDIAQFTKNFKESDGEAVAPVILLGKPRTQAPTTVINQMPTTGAPEGLSFVGLSAVGVGMLGVLLVFVRRRHV